MSKCTLKIFHQKWIFTVIADDEFTRRFGEDTTAITCGDERTIYFRKDDFKLGFVRHELLHAWMRSLPHTSAELDARQTEEVIADILSDEFDLFIHQSQTIFSKLSGKPNV
jgi:hypothetical protein